VVQRPERSKKFFQEFQVSHKMFVENCRECGAQEIISCVMQNFLLLYFIYYYLFLLLLLLLFFMVFIQVAKLIGPTMKLYGKMFT